MRMISIRKNKPFFDEHKRLIQPFQPFDCSTSFAKSFGRNNPHLLAVEDFVSIVAHRPIGEIRQMAKNAGMDHTLPEGELRSTFLALAQEEPEVAPSEEGPEEGDRAELLEMTVTDLRKMASDLNISGYANVRKPELVDLILGTMGEPEE